MKIDTTRFHREVQASSPERKRVRSLVAARLERTADRDASRSMRYEIRSKTNAGLWPEAMQGSTVDFQSARFLPLGAQARRAVAYVEVEFDNKIELGSGFLISRDLGKYVASKADGRRSRERRQINGRPFDRGDARNDWSGLLDLHCCSYVWRSVGRGIFTY